MTFKLLLILILFHQILLPTFSAPFPSRRRKLPDSGSSNSTTDACSLCLCYIRNNKQYVDCSLADVTSMPTNIPANTSRLLLHGQGLTDIGITNFIPHLPKLRDLHLNANPISNISIDAFQSVTHLRTLLLHFTSITELPDGIFANMSHLRNLWINNAAITTVGPNVFRGLAKLESLKLQGNKISEFSLGQFYGLPNIQELDITNQQGNETLFPTCCMLCGVNPSSVSMDDRNDTALHSMSGDDYSDGENSALRCGTKFVTFASKMSINTTTLNLYHIFRLHWPC